MNDPQYQRLKELSWKRPLSPEEEKTLRELLQNHPEHQPDWESEVGLNHLLGHLSDAPLSSNFNAQVLSAIEREKSERAALRRRRSHSYAPNWLPRWSVAFLAVALVLFSVQQHRSSNRAEMARSVARVSSVASLSEIGWLKDFDAIRGLSAIPATDDDKLLNILETRK